MSDRFEICYPITAAHEGGWSDHKADPGGKTMYGVTEVRWHEYQRKMGMKRTPVRNITKDQALKFYRSEFWDTCGAPSLFPGVDLATFDSSVNSGVSRGRKWLLASVGNHGHDETVRRICRARLAFMKNLKIWATFGRGWARRVTDIEAKGVVMALEAMGKTNQQIRVRAAAEAASAERAANAATVQTKAAAGASLTVPTGASQIETFTTETWVFLAIVTALFLGAAIHLIRKRRENEARAASYKEVIA